MSTQDLILQLVEIRVKRFLLREKQQTQGILYARTGRGANPQEFEVILQKLSAEGFLTLKASERTSVLVSLVQQPASNEEQIA